MLRYFNNVCPDCSRDTGDIMKETEQDLSLVFQNCPLPAQTNLTNSAGRLEDHNDLCTEPSSLAIRQPDRPGDGQT